MLDKDPNPRGPMRQFTRARQNVAIDSVSNFQCLSTGIIVSHMPAIHVYSSIYRFKNLSTKEDRDFAVLAPLSNTVRIVDGKSLYQFVLDKKYTTSLLNIIKSKSFFNFSEADLLFLEYIASGIAAATPTRYPFRALVVAFDDEVLAAGLEIPQNIERSESRLTVLFDTKNMFG